MNVKNAILNDTLNEEIYMQQPRSFIDEGNPMYVCKLN